ncbi:DUF4362 domain-containing protein [Paenibacillus melissococcoides]|uniref:DUF4362 domain-containing protein n=2 Tax=Paenibacillus TaxID=44249 RepID=A0ABM9G902_9BACL|nr:DUF4362 domain-containing protein [Paenibacillus melissococcoides]CAH8248246.1 DUF4362 domain-containing protein [Paenibacillus melissococcoides]CAH8718056.1 DUF4362 domain-containing protein [Paenibacillus melissococcoides]CAH8719066.1 DUF4362 domain-containing protein [Paenibacillus melissococcoides]
MTGIVILNGCSYSASNHDLPGRTGTASKHDTVGETTQASSDSEAQDEVFWSHREIRNLQRLDKFVENVKQKIKDEINVLASTKEGDVIHTNVAFDGNAIQVTVNGTQETYERISIEERFNAHYNGTFIEYRVRRKDDESKKKLILQIHPDLQRSP